MTTQKNAANKEVCLSCKREASPQLIGAWYNAKGSNGMLVSFWMCNPCAIPLGVSQGPIDMEGVGKPAAGQKK
jgi:hypothetical protein